MDNDQIIGALGYLYGIAPDFWDIWGNRHETSQATRIALLRAMGVDATDPEAAQRALIEREARVWKRWLPPVRVIRVSGGPASIEVALPERDASTVLAWTLDLESGERHDGVFEPGHAECLERREWDGVAYLRFRVSLGEQFAPGYHRLVLRHGADIRARQTLIVAPDRCYLPPRLLAGERVFGPAAQLYALRHERDLGIGDYTALAALVAYSAQTGGDAVGISPLHALFRESPAHASPYSPNSRLFLNTLYLDIEAVPEFASCAPARGYLDSDAAMREIARLRAAPMVDYPGVARIKSGLLEMLYAHFRATDIAQNTARASAFRRFVAESGAALARFTLFEALAEHFHAHGIAGGFTAWPDEFRDPDSEACRAFGDMRRERLEYFGYLQWLAHDQVHACAEQARHRDLIVGLYKDLAVSAAPDGAEVWSQPGAFARGVSVGCPPDDFNLNGQNWGLPPFSPDALAESAYAPFIALLRANMRDAGALRIDHVMGLMRLFWIPEGRPALEGAYVHYPFADLLGILALESQRNHCLVIGEDLGTVPDEVRAGLANSGVLAYRVFWFEREGQGDFKAPQHWMEQALATVSTHDLPTLAGFWHGDDIAERIALDLFPSEALRDQVAQQRVQDRARLLAALAREGLLEEGDSTDPAAWAVLTPRLIRAVHAYVARAASRMMMFQLEDFTGMRTQVNLPGTSEERANWRLRLPKTVRELFDDDVLREALAVLRQARGRDAVSNL